MIAFLKASKLDFGQPPDPPPRCAATSPVILIVLLRPPPKKKARGIRCDFIEVAGIHGSVTQPLGGGRLARRCRWKAIVIDEIVQVIFEATR